MSDRQQRNENGGPETIKVEIDGRSVRVEAGGTLLTAIRKAGLDVPTLCHALDLEPQTSCMLCVVHELGSGRLLPSCSALAEAGMRIETGGEKVLEARRQALSLLLSEHAGDCEAPCRRICPAHMDIPKMIRQIASGDLRGAIQTVKRDIALPAVMGRVCPAPCEKGCRRDRLDEAVAICKLKQFVADVDLSSGESWLPECLSGGARRVAIVGSGPAGLAAAWHLLQMGHGCVIYDSRIKPGGMLRYGIPEERLPRDVLDREIRLIADLGAEFRQGVQIGRDMQPDDLLRDYDAVILAVGSEAAHQAAAGFGIETSESGIVVTSHTFATSRAGVFAIGDALRTGRMAIRSLAHGKAVAWAIDQAGRGDAVRGEPRRFDSRLGPMDDEELNVWVEGADPAPRQLATDSEGDLNADQAVAESRRCLHCDCYRADDCRLREYAEEYGVETPRRGGHARRPVRCDPSHPTVRYESGKCISCGLCVRRAVASGDRQGMTFTHRGFEMSVGPALGATIADALGDAAGDCVEACPTGALSWKDLSRGREP